MRSPAILIALLVVTFPSADIPCARSVAAPTSAPAITPESLRALSNADLLVTYESTAIAAGATDVPTSAVSPCEYDERCLLVRAEIVRRGGAIAPLLAAALKREVTLKRPETPGHFTPGLVTDELRLLTRIGDPRSVEPLLDIVQMKGASKDEWRDPRFGALSAVEKITFVCFHRVKPHFGNFSQAVQHPGTLGVDSFSPDELPKVVRLYREWLAGEGKDPAQWLPLARTRARAFLEGEDLNDAYCGAAFLTEPFNRDAVLRYRDELPDRTLNRLGQILGGAKPVPGGKTHDYQYQGKPLPISLYNWISFITAYGPRARPYAGILIRFQHENGLDNWGGLREMAKVGGPEIMAYYVEALPVISRKADAIRNDPATPAGFSSDDPRLGWLTAQQECRDGIDRWAGRRFDGDAARLAWWEANKDKSPEQWLRDSLPITAARADTGDKYETWLFRQLLPDAPCGTDERLGMATPINTPGTTPLPFRKRWFEQHQFEFVYDPDAGAFYLPNAPR